jgi:hypothetical protein
MHPLDGPWKQTAMRGPPEQLTRSSKLCEPFAAVAKVAPRG